MSYKPADPNAPWFPGHLAAKMTCRNTRTIRDLAARGLVAVFEPDGVRPLYSRGAILERLIPPATAPPRLDLRRPLRKAGRHGLEIGVAAAENRGR